MLTNYFLLIFINMKSLIKKLLKEYFEDDYDFIDFTELKEKKPKLKVDNNFNSFVNYLGAKKTQNKMNSFFITNGPSTIFFKKTSNPKKIELDLITTDDFERGKGYAKDVMQKFIDGIDKYKYTTVLSVVPRDKKTTPEQLIKFYSGYGFRFNGNDFEMIR